MNPVPLHRPLRCLARLSSLALVCCLTGCGGKHLVYLHEATLGIHATLGADQSQKLVFGYDSETFALVPERNGEDENGGKEAMTLVSAARVDATGLNEIIFNHVVVTGRAAEEAVKDPHSLQYFRKAVFPNEPSAPTP